MRIPTIFQNVIFVLLFFSATLEAQTLQIGIIKFYPPFEIQTNVDQFTGFDTDLIGLICQQLRVACKFKPLQFKDIFTALDTGEINLAISAISITKKRQEKYLFSLPYLASFVQFLTLESSSIKTEEDINGKRIGILTSAVTRKFIQIGQSNGTKIKNYTVFNDMFTDLMNKKIDVILIDYYAARYWQESSDKKFKLIGKKIPLGMGYGIMTQKNNQALIQSINKILLNLEANGQYLKLYNIYLGEF